MTTPLFTVTVGFNDESKTYGALVSALDGKHAALEDASLKKILWRLRELILEKTAELQDQKLLTDPEPEVADIRVLTPADFRPPLVGADGKVLNGHS